MCRKQAHVASGIGCRAAKVERGCEAGEFKEFSCVLTGTNQAHCTSMKVWLSKALFIFAALSLNKSVHLDFYNRVLQLNNLATESQTS